MFDMDTPHTASLADDALPIGATLSGGQFTITGHLGVGGFGKTYRAEDNVLGRTIVIKECFPEDFCTRNGLNVVPRAEAYAAPFRSTVEMFIREARSLAKLRHPNIVGVHRAFEENQTAYMALDLIEGYELLSIMESRKAKLSPAQIRGILMQMLAAIEKVHAMDLLHRDISPDNIIIEPTGTPVLIDFGAARGDASRRTRAVSSMLVVKDGYSPQEFYVAGSEQGPSSDLYALAATFYHAISGEVPANSQTRMVEIAGRRPDPCRPLAGRIEGYAPGFLEAIDAAMRIHPGDRLQSAAEWRRIIAKPAAPARAPAAAPASAPTAAAPAQPVAQAPAPAPTHDAELSADLVRVLSQLVEETNAEVRSAPTPRIARKPAKPAPAKSLARPDWVEEFNRDTLERERWAASPGGKMESDHAAPRLTMEFRPHAPGSLSMTVCPSTEEKEARRRHTVRSLGKLLDFGLQRSGTESPAATETTPTDPTDTRPPSKSLPWRKAS